MVSRIGTFIIGVALGLVTAASSPTAFLMAETHGYAEGGRRSVSTRL